MPETSLSAIAASSADDLWSAANLLRNLAWIANDAGFKPEVLEGDFAQGLYEIAQELDNTHTLLKTASKCASLQTQKG